MMFKPVPPDEGKKMTKEELELSLAYNRELIEQFKTVSEAVDKAMRNLARSMGREFDILDTVMFQAVQSMFADIPVHVLGEQMPCIMKGKLLMDEMKKLLKWFEESAKEIQQELDARNKPEPPSDSEKPIASE
jgi:hypothetical protein